MDQRLGLDVYRNLLPLPGMEPQFCDHPAYQTSYATRSHVEVYFFVFGFQPLITNFTVSVAQDATTWFPLLPLHAFMVWTGEDLPLNNIKKWHCAYNVVWCRVHVAIVAVRSPFYYALSQNCEKRLSDSCVSVWRPSAWNNSAPTGQIFMKFDIWEFFEKKTVEKIQDSFKIGQE